LNFINEFIIGAVTGGLLVAAVMGFVFIGQIGKLKAECFGCQWRYWKERDGR